MYILLSYNKINILRGHPRQVVVSTTTGAGSEGKMVFERENYIKKRTTEETAFDKCAVD